MQLTEASLDGLVRTYLRVAKRMQAMKASRHSTSYYPQGDMAQLGWEQEQERLDSASPWDMLMSSGHWDAVNEAAIKVWGLDWMLLYADEYPIPED